MPLEEVLVAMTEAMLLSSVVLVLLLSVLVRLGSGEAGSDGGSRLAVVAEGAGFASGGGVVSLVMIWRRKGKEGWVRE